MKYIALLIFCFLIFSTPATAEETRHFLKYEGYKRYYIVHTPPNFDKSQPLPMVIMMHGGGGTAEGFMQQTSMNDVADKNNFIVIYPSGIKSFIGKFHTWNAVECCGRAVKRNVDDVGFISHVIDLMKADYNIDTTRVYASGHSNGAMMSYRLACKLSDKITAIAPNAGALSFDDCTLKRPVPILHFHGVQDQCVPYYGGDQCGGCFQQVMRKTTKLPWAAPHRTCEPIPKITDIWAKRNGCTNDTQETFKKGDVTCQSWQGCKADVTLCSIENSGHIWAGGKYGLDCDGEKAKKKICKTYKEVIGNINKDINTSQMIWQFFFKYSLN